MSEPVRRVKEIEKGVDMSRALRYRDRMLMRAFLVFPAPAGLAALGNYFKVPLVWTNNHTLAHSELGVTLWPLGEVFEGHVFRSLRDKTGAWIESEDPDLIAGSMGLPYGEAGLVRKEPLRHAIGWRAGLA